MPKTTTEGMIKSMVWCLANRNIKNVSDISSDTGLDRLAVKRYVYILSEIGVFIPHYRGERVYYTLNPDIQRYLVNESKSVIEQELEGKE